MPLNGIVSLTLATESATVNKSISSPPAARPLTAKLALTLTLVIPTSRTHRTATQSAGRRAYAWAIGETVSAFDRRQRCRRGGPVGLHPQVDPLADRERFGGRRAAMPLVHLDPQFALPGVIAESVFISPCLASILNREGGIDNRRLSACRMARDALLLHDWPHVTSPFFRPRHVFREVRNHVGWKARGSALKHRLGERSGYGSHDNRFLSRLAVPDATSGPLSKLGHRRRLPEM